MSTVVISIFCQHITNVRTLPVAEILSFDTGYQIYTQDYTIPSHIENNSWSPIGSLYVNFLAFKLEICSWAEIFINFTNEKIPYLEAYGSRYGWWLSGLVNTYRIKIFLKTITIQKKVWTRYVIFISDKQVRQIKKISYFLSIHEIAVIRLSNKVSVYSLNSLVPLFCSNITMHEDSKMKKNFLISVTNLRSWHIAFIIQ